ncbi:hypothetical protein ACIA49_35345 [Kribbella sp. NPDC051587]|uniref:hypothetical protein n=1 Tax=Kribbella sp. NPDC051587 TaxID=3364119 RepID=UPI0037BCC0A9
MSPGGNRAVWVVVVVLIAWLVAFMGRQNLTRETASMPQATGVPVTVRTMTVAPSVKGTTMMPALARMDADQNGIPCETVYSGAVVNDFWFQ